MEVFHVHSHPCPFFQINNFSVNNCKKSLKIPKKGIRRRKSKNDRQFTWLKD